MKNNINEFEKYYLNTEQKEQKEPTIEDLQKEKIKEQILTLKQKRNAQTQSETVLYTIHKTIKILIYAILAPVFILGFFFVECAKEAGRSGRGRRR